VQRGLVVGELLIARRVYESALKLGIGAETTVGDARRPWL